MGIMWGVCQSADYDVTSWMESGSFQSNVSRHSRRARIREVELLNGRLVAPLTSCNRHTDQEFRFTTFERKDNRFFLSKRSKWIILSERNYISAEAETRKWSLYSSISGGNICLLKYTAWNHHLYIYYHSKSPNIFHQKTLFTCFISGRNIVT